MSQGIMAIDSILDPPDSEVACQPPCEPPFPYPYSPTSAKFLAPSQENTATSLRPGATTPPEATSKHGAPPNDLSAEVVYLTQDDDDTESPDRDTANSTTAAKRKRGLEAPQPLSKRQHSSIEVELVACALIKVWSEGTETDPPPIGYVTKVEVKIERRDDAVLLFLDQSRRVFRGQVEEGVLTVTKGEVASTNGNSRWLYGYIYPNVVDIVTFVRTVKGSEDCVLV